MKRSSESTCVSRRSSRRFSSAESGARKAPDSIFSRSHMRWRCDAMCSIS
jgi:hypothetical protein